MVEKDNQTLGSLSYSILEDLIRPLAHEATLKAVQREKAIRRKYGKEFAAKTLVPLPALSSSSSSALSTGSTPTQNGNGASTPKQGKQSSAGRQEISGRINYFKIAGRDIYGNEKPTAIRYFECENCKRKVATSRFAAHIERCLSGRNARARTYGGDSSASPPDSSKRPSPKKRKLDETFPKTQVSKFIDRAKPIHSVPASRDSSPAAAHRSMSEDPESYPRKKPVPTTN